MIDFIKCYTLDRNERIINKFRKNPNCVYQKVDSSTGELTFPIIIKRENMEFRFTKKSQFVSNSLHKFYNSISGNGKQNYDDFSYSKLKKSIQELEQLFKISGKETSITNLEFGLNIEVPEVCRLINNNILFYKLRPHSSLKNITPDECFKQFQSSKEYYIKVYDKGRQYFLNREVIRFEIKYKSKRMLQRLGVYSLADLLKKEVLKSIYDDFIEKMNEMLIVDSYDGNFDSTEESKNKLINFTNPQYWIKMNELIRKNEYSRQMKSKRKIEFNNLLADEDLLKNRKYLFSLLNEKFNKLINS